MHIGQHAPAEHVIAHVSDTHVGAGSTVYGRIRAAEQLRTVMDRIEEIAPDAIVFTGDVADAGESAAYETVRSIVEPAAARIGAEVVWVMGNHDARAPFARHLMGVEADPDAPLDHVTELDGLRIVAVDTTIPGYHDGRLSAAQLDWLRDVLASPAPHGTVLAMHHPPIPSHMPLMTVIELADQHQLAEAVEGTDVRVILAGHYHYSAHSTLGSVPVHVGSSTCYVVDTGADPRGMHAVDAPVAFDLVHVHADRVVHSSVPVSPGALVLDYPVESLDHVSAMTAEVRRETFARASADIDAIALVRGDTLDG